MRPVLVVDNAAERVPIGLLKNPASSDLARRAKIVERQLAYFGLVIRKCSFEEAVPSAERAGFAVLEFNGPEKEAVLQWAAEPDFLFSLSFKNPEMIAIVAESRNDISGLNLVSLSGAAEVSVELKPWLGMNQLGRNALEFRDLLLSFPRFVETPAWVSASGADM